MGLPPRRNGNLQMVDIWQKRFRKSLGGHRNDDCPEFSTDCDTVTCGHLGVLLRTRKYIFLCLGQI